jgi:hypothetical protein
LQLISEGDHMEKKHPVRPLFTTLRVGPRQIMESSLTPGHMEFGLSIGITRHMMIIKCDCYLYPHLI